MPVVVDGVENGAVVGVSFDWELEGAVHAALLQGVVHLGKHLRSGGGCGKGGWVLHK